MLVRELFVLHSKCCGGGWKSLFCSAVRVLLRALFRVLFGALKELWELLMPRLRRCTQEVVVGTSEGAFLAWKRLQGACFRSARVQVGCWGAGA